MMKSMNAARTTDLATITARIKAAHAGRMARLAPMGTMPKIGSTVVQGNFERKGKVIEVGQSIVKVRDAEGDFPVMIDSFRTTVRPWRVLGA